MTDTERLTKIAFSMAARCGVMVAIFSDSKTLTLRVQNPDGTRWLQHAIRLSYLPVAAQARRLRRYIREFAGASPFAEAPVVWHTGKAIGEVIGELKKVDDLDADNEVVLVPATGPDFIRCTFPEAMKTEIGKFLFKKVKVKGILTYDSLSPHPKKVQILDGGISLYPDSASVVKFADLRGIFAGRKRQQVVWDF